MCLFINKEQFEQLEFKESTFTPISICGYITTIQIAKLFNNELAVSNYS